MTDFELKTSHLMFKPYFLPQTQSEKEVQTYTNSNVWQ